MNQAFYRNTPFSPLPLSCNNTAHKTLGPLTSCLVLSSLPPSCCLSPLPLPAQVGQDELDEKRFNFRSIVEAFLFGGWFYFISRDDCMHSSIELQFGTATKTR